jgi:hypothetical protein
VEGFLVEVLRLDLVSSIVESDRNLSRARDRPEAER